jgi:signal transduction histidine kinase
MTTLGSLWRALTIFRWATLAWAGFLIVRDHKNFQHPLAGLVVLAVMAAWTFVASVGYERYGKRVPRWMLGADLGIAAAVSLATLYVVKHEVVLSGAGLLPSSWAAGAVAAWAIAWGPWWGMAAGSTLGVAGWLAHGGLDRGGLEHAHVSQQSASELVLFLLVGGVVGHLVRLARRGADDLARAVELQAATGERERLAREIHDSVLQALALIHRRGREAGGVAADLADLAAAQEIELRRLVAKAPVEVYGAEVDLRESLRRTCDAATVSVEFAAPAAPVLVPARCSHGLAAAATQALDNVARHAGPKARAWVLLDDDGETITVSIRDNGVGCTAADLADAAAAGRLGVAQSMRGRIEGLGGTMCLEAMPGQGVEVEFRVGR